MTDLSPHRSPHVQRGVAIVEFTIVLPLLLFMMLATAEFGRMLGQYEALTKSVRDSCRYLASQASVNAGTTQVISITSSLQTQTQNLAVYGNVNGTGSALLPNLATNNITVTAPGNSYVSVAAAYTYVPIIGATLPSFGLGAPISLGITLNSTVTMRAL